MLKKIRVDQGEVEGYGGPGYLWARITCDNILLETFKSHDEGRLAVSIYKAQQKWSKDWTSEEWEAATHDKEQASPLCSVCGRHTLDGSSSCVNMTFCKRCRPRIDEFRKKYQDGVDEAQRASELRQQAEYNQRTEQTRAALVGAYHWREGWYFKRTSDGSVRVMRPARMPMADYEYLERDLTIPSNEWASIVCSVSADGETGERWNAAQDFHGRAALSKSAPEEKS